MHRNCYICDLIRRNWKWPSHLSSCDPGGASLSSHLPQPNCLGNEAPGDDTAVFRVASEIAKSLWERGGQHSVCELSIITCPPLGHFSMAVSQTLEMAILENSLARRHAGVPIEWKIASSKYIHFRKTKSWAESFPPYTLIRLDWLFETWMGGLQGGLTLGFRTFMSTWSLFFSVTVLQG